MINGFEGNGVTIEPSWWKDVFTEHCSIAMPVYCLEQ
jgi:hypothetical protein